MVKFPAPPAAVREFLTPLPSFGRPRLLIWLACEYFKQIFSLWSTHKSHNYTHQHSRRQGCRPAGEAAQAIY